MSAMADPGDGVEPPAMPAAAVPFMAGHQNEEIRAAFFSPAAEEVGGVFEGENPTTNTLLHGWFAGSQ